MLVFLCIIIALNIIVFYECYIFTSLLYISISNIYINIFYYDDGFVSYL